MYQSKPPSQNLTMNRDTEWGPEWSCPANMDFCALEGMCNFKDSCPISPSGMYLSIQHIGHINLLLLHINYSLMPEVIRHKVQLQQLSDCHS